VLGEVLPSSVLAPDLILRELPTIAEAWYSWLIEQYAPEKERKALRKVLRALIRRMPELLEELNRSPMRPYIADLTENGHDGSYLQQVLDRHRYTAALDRLARWCGADVAHVDGACEFSDLRPLSQGAIAGDHLGLRLVVRLVEAVVVQVPMGPATAENQVQGDEQPGALRPAVRPSCS